MDAFRQKRSYAERHHNKPVFRELPLEPLSQANLGVRRAFASDVLFAERVVEENTTRFYTRRGDKWRTSVFLAAFDEHDTFILFANGERAGVLQLKGKVDALWICTLEVMTGSAAKGLSDAAVEYAMTCARRLGYGNVKVKLFAESAVLELYKKHGFTATRTDGNLIWLERSTSVF